MIARRLVYCFICLFLWQTSSAQLVINNTYTPTQLVQNFLIGNGVTVSNVTVNGGSDPLQFGFFTNANSNLPLDSGIVMMTGYTNDLNNIATNIDGAFTSNHPNPPTGCNGGICGPGDTDLDAIVAPDPTNDAAVLEFDFVPVADTVRFRYVFASEEYNEYVCSDFNDVFAFFISGPGFGAPTNIAIIPGTNPPLPVSINNVNNGTVGSSGNASNCTAAQLANSAFFIDNTSGAHVQFDGMTVALEAWAVVQPCSTYHIKLAIADVFDASFDSGIFLEAGSFSSNGLVVESVTANGDSIITEQCNTGQINFVFNTPPTNDTTFHFTIGGTATNGTDYQLIADSITVQAGDSSATVDIIPITDNIAEGIETITIIIPTNICSSDTIQLFIGEETPPAAPDNLHCYTIQDSIIAFGWDSVAGATGYQISTDNGATWIPANGNLSHQFTGVPPNTNVGIWVSAVDSNLICTMPLVDSLVCMDCGLHANVDTTIATCETDTNGAANLTITIGTAPYTYAWSNGDTTLNLTNVAAGIYNLSVTDANGCTTVVPSVGIDTLFGPGVTATTSDQSCDSLGSITLQVSGGTPPFTYLWSNNATTQTITGLTSGTYTASITGAGCTSTVTALVDSVGPPVVTLDTSINQTCTNPGSIAITTTGGLAPYTYLWNNNETTEDINGLVAGNYTVTVTGANNCSVTLNVTVGSTNVPVVTLDSVQHVDCFLSGAILTTVTNGTSPYTFLWSNNATTEDITGLTTGTYSLTVTDDNNCTTTLSNVFVDSSSGPMISATIVDQTCSNQGSITITTTGGTAPLNFAWSNNATTQNITGLAGGNYSLTVTDANNCTSDSSFTVGQTTPISLTIDSSAATLACDLSPIGQLTANATGGNPPLTYAWSNNVSTASNTGLGAGTYIVTVTDGDCIAIDTATVIAPDVPVLNAFIGQSPVIDSSIYLNQSITIDANNSASGTFTYSWTAMPNTGAGLTSPNAASSTVQPTDTGVYVYTVVARRTSNGITCTDSDTVTLTVNQEEFLGMPTAFTPNGDGANDFYLPVRMNPAFVTQFIIYNRWGQKVYDDAGLSGGQGWDGNLNSVPQAQDVYLYFLEYQLPGEAKQVIRGEFTLLR